MKVLILDISANPNEITLLVGIAFFIAGIVKGVIGIGLPTTAITIMTFFISPLTALGLNLIPMTVSNIWQFSKADNYKALFNDYKYFAFFLFWLGPALGIFMLVAPECPKAFSIYDIFGNSIVEFYGFFPPGSTPPPVDNS